VRTRQLTSAKTIYHDSLRHTFSSTWNSSNYWIDAKVNPVFGVNIVSQNRSDVYFTRFNVVLQKEFFSIRIFRVLCLSLSTSVNISLPSVSTGCPERASLTLKLFSQNFLNHLRHGESSTALSYRIQHIFSFAKYSCLLGNKKHNTPKMLLIFLPFLMLSEI